MIIAPLFYYYNIIIFYNKTIVKLKREFIIVQGNGIRKILIA